MTKYITVKLTEDQAYSIIRLIESWQEPVEWAIKNDKATEYSIQNLAFRKRILVKLAQALVTEQAKR